MNTHSTIAYLLLSGGQDSFVSLLWAKKKFSTVRTLTINYGQRHHLEIEKAKAIAKMFSIENTIIDLKGIFQNVKSALLEPQSSLQQNHQISTDLPSSFVPNRNGIFLTILANYAFMQTKNALSEINLVIGACQTDYSGYPDCREEYMKAKARELSLGLNRVVKIHTPLMWLTKAETFKMAQNYGYLAELIANTVSCYDGSSDPNIWGIGCAECPACKLRKKGYEEFKNNISV